MCLCARVGYGCGFFLSMSSGKIGMKIEHSTENAIRVNNKKKTFCSSNEKVETNITFTFCLFWVALFDFFCYRILVLVSLILALSLSHALTDSIFNFLFTYFALRFQCLHFLFSLFPSSRVRVFFCIRIRIQV